MATIQESLGCDIKHQKDFVKTATGGDLQTITGLDNVREAVLRRLITTPGSVVHRPQYGAGLQEFLNAPATIATKRAIAARIDDQLTRDPRIEEVLSVGIEGDSTAPDKFTISVRIKVVGYGETTMRFIPFGEVA